MSVFMNEPESVSLARKGLEHAKCEMKRALQSEYPVGSRVSVRCSRANVSGVVVCIDFEYRICVKNDKTGKIGKWYPYEVFLKTRSDYQQTESDLRSNG